MTIVYKDRFKILESYMRYVYHIIPTDKYKAL